MGYLRLARLARLARRRALLFLLALPRTRRTGERVFNTLIVAACFFSSSLATSSLVIFSVPGSMPSVVLRRLESPPMGTDSTETASSR